jgi:expansin (peptidoglycan-binding protein)
MAKRRKYIALEATDENHKTVGRLGIGDLAVLQCGDLRVTVLVDKLERAPQR